MGLLIFFCAGVLLFWVISRNLWRIDILHQADRPFSFESRGPAGAFARKHYFPANDLLVPDLAALFETIDSASDLALLNFDFNSFSIIAIKSWPWPREEELAEFFSILRGEVDKCQAYSLRDFQGRNRQTGLHRAEPFASISYGASLMLLLIVDEGYMTAGVRLPFYDASADNGYGPISGVGILLATPQRGVIRGRELNGFSVPSLKEIISGLVQEMFEKQA